MKKHLVANSYSIDGLKLMTNWDELTPKEQKELESYSKYEPLLARAEAWIKENGHKDYLLLKSHAEFKELAAYDHFKKKARNQQYYKSRAASKANTDAGSVSSAKHSLSDHSITSRMP